MVEIDRTVFLSNLGGLGRATSLGNLGGAFCYERTLDTLRGVLQVEIVESSVFYRLEIIRPIVNRS